MKFTEDDQLTALPGYLRLVGSDVEINANVRGPDVIVRVNKANILICRILLEDAAKDMSVDTLINFSPFAPDFLFKVGDNAEGMERLRRSVGME